MKRPVLQGGLILNENQRPPSVRDVAPVKCPVLASDDANKLASIREAVQVYYTALNNREHGGVAMDKAFSKIQNVLGMRR